MTAEQMPRWVPPTMHKPVVQPTYWAPPPVVPVRPVDPNVAPGWQRALAALVVVFTLGGVYFALAVFAGLLTGGIGALVVIGAACAIHAGQVNRALAVGR